MLHEVCSKITDKGITVERQYSMMFKSWILLLGLVLSRPNATRANGPTYVYIDTVSGYDELSKCAEIPLSTIVRNMENGCRDGSQLTSYSCFCTDSYQKFNFDISTAVLAQCGRTISAQAMSAVKVFQDYCIIDTEADLSTTSSVCTKTSIKQYQSNRC